jgi:hypothetical protein
MPARPVILRAVALACLHSDLIRVPGVYRDTARSGCRQCNFVLVEKNSIRGIVWWYSGELCYRFKDAKLVARTLIPPELAFTSVYFFESGLFNGLRAIGVKNLLLPQAGGRTSRRSAFLPFALLPPHLGRLGFDQPKVYGRFSETPRFCLPPPKRYGRISSDSSGFKAGMHP